MQRPVRERLQVATDLLSDQRRQLEKLLDLYLTGDFPKELLVDRKVRLEATIAAVEKESAHLRAQLDAESLTAQEIANLEEYAARVAQGLNLAAQDFELRRATIEALDVTGILTIEVGEQVVHAQCILGERSLAMRRVPDIRAFCKRKPTATRVVRPNPDRSARPSARQTAR